MISRGASAGARIPHAAAAPLPPSVPGLLMHFDGNFVDECRGRSFSLTGGSAADATGMPALAGAGALADGVPMPILTTEHAADFNFVSGAFTIEFFIRRAAGTQVTGLLVEYLEIVSESYLSLVWQVSHIHGEGLSIPVFTHRSDSGVILSDNAAFYTQGEWDHIAFVSGDGSGELRTYKNGNLVVTRYRLVMSDIPAGALRIWGNANAMIDDLRILPQEVYTGSSFTPPTAPLSRTHPPT